MKMNIVTYQDHALYNNTANKSSHAACYALFFSILNEMKILWSHPINCHATLKAQEELSQTYIWLCAKCGMFLYMMTNWGKVMEMSIVLERQHASLHGCYTDEGLWPKSFHIDSSIQITWDN